MVWAHCKTTGIVYLFSYVNSFAPLQVTICRRVARVTIRNHALSGWLNLPNPSTCFLFCFIISLQMRWHYGNDVRIKTTRIITANPSQSTVTIETIGRSRTQSQPRTNALSGLAIQLAHGSGRQHRFSMLYVVFFFCLTILAFSLYKTMAANYFNRFPSAVPLGSLTVSSSPLPPEINKKK